jgi:trk system potassium uptake protein TrkH
VVNTGSGFTLPGQVVILLLIQVGGLGVMTFAAVAFQVLGLRLPLVSQAALQDSIFGRDAARDLGRVFWRILKLTALIELGGAVVLFFCALPASGAASSAFIAVFHAVSAFCNAGFSIYRNNLVDVRGNHGFIAACGLLIVAGGLGHTVLVELWDAAKGAAGRARARRGEARNGFTLHARVVLLVSGSLVLAGACGALLLGLSPGDVGWTGRISGALFQSVSSRTAGFNTVDLGAAPVSALMLLAALMFIGGSPGSCAGGIKTSTFAVWLARLRSLAAGREDVTLLGRRIPELITRKTSLIIALAILWNLAGVMMLLVTEGGRPGMDLARLVFEQISAFGTVGLSTGITPDLSPAGKVWIILTMFLGRLGPLTLAMTVIAEKAVRYRLPEERVMVG